MIEIRFLDKNKKTLKKEIYNSEAKVNTLFEMISGDLNTRKLIPTGCNFIMVEDKYYWVDRRKNIWQVREVTQ